MNEDYHTLIRGGRTGVVATLQRGGLWVLSAGYRLGVAARNRAFEWGWRTIHKAGVPVVSVGNLTVGGTGKTPCVEYVARFYRQRNLQVALLSRGYGSAAGRNDEALVLEENLPDVPHLQGAERVPLARTAVEELESEVLVLDDGFQHRQLHRDLDVVLIDATCPWGHGHLLPRGLLREPVSGLRRASIVMLTRCDLATAETVAGIRRKVSSVKASLPIVESTHRPSEWSNAAQDKLPLEALRERPIAGFCGIGNPEAFRQTLASLGLKLTDWRSFPDHHPYNRADVEGLRAWARQLPQGTAIVTTQKDLVKIRLDRLDDKELWALRIELQVLSGQEALDACLRKVVENAQG